MKLSDIRLNTLYKVILAERPYSIFEEGDIFKITKDGVYFFYSQQIIPFDSLKGDTFRRITAVPIHDILTVNTSKIIY